MLQIEMIFIYILGASDASTLAYVHLEIKNTQLDSLGYLHTFQMFNEGRFQNASKLYSTTVRFFSHNYREVGRLNKISIYILFNNNFPNDFLIINLGCRSFDNIIQIWFLHKNYRICRISRKT